MNDELWKKCQMMIDAGFIDMVAHLLVKEVQENLTVDQLKPLGDLNSFFLKAFSKKQDMSAKKFVNGFIDLARKGVILGQKQE